MPFEDISGAKAIVYTVFDGRGGLAVGTITITITGSPTRNSITIPVGSGFLECAANDLCFTPSELIIPVGDQVTWINDDNSLHAIISGTPHDNDAGGMFDSGLLGLDATYSFTFVEAGLYDYFCAIHPWMTGVVTVEPNSPSMAEGG